jgi:uncharacterized protein YnzC (UPF0291/DUF896 family)
MKFSDKKLDKMLPGSRQWQDQVDRINYGAPKQKETTMHENMEFVKQQEQAERRILRQIWMHNTRMK